VVEVDVVGLLEVVTDEEVELDVDVEVEAEVLEVVDEVLVTTLPQPFIK